MKIRALVPFSTGTITMEQYEIREVSDAVGAKLVAAKLATEISGGGERFIVTLTPTAADYSGTMDKTVAEINAAYEEGQEIWFKIAAGTDWTEYPLSRVGKLSGDTYPSFNCNALYDENNVLVMIYTGTTNDGTKQTYSTKVYTLTPATKEST